MAATLKKNIWFFSSDDGVAPQVVTRLIAASQGIFMPGAPCYISTSGTVKLADTSDGTGDVVHGFIVGCANADTVWPLEAQLAANTEVKVALISLNHLYAIYVENAGSDSALAQAQVGNSYGLTVATTPAGSIGYTTLNIANTNTTVNVVNGMFNVEPLRNAAADNPGIALVRFLNANVNAVKA